MRRKLYLIAYDVREPNRLAAALRVVKGFATGGQKSVYECFLDEKDKTALRVALDRVLDLTVDSVAFIRLAPRVPMTALGVAVAPADPNYFYFG